MFRKLHTQMTLIFYARHQLLHFASRLALSLYLREQLKGKRVSFFFKGAKYHDHPFTEPVRHFPAMADAASGGQSFSHLIL